MSKPDKVLHYRIGEKVIAESVAGVCRVVVVNNFDYTLGIEMEDDRRVTVTPDQVTRVENE